MSSRRMARGGRCAHAGIGIAGCGSAAELLHLPALRRLGVPVTALADPDRRALQRVGERFDIARRYPDTAALLEDPGVQVIAVLTPPEVRVEIVVPALEAGRHVLIEKPLALTVAECDQMVDAAVRHPGSRAMVGFATRFHRLAVAARDLIAAGKLGDVSAVQTASFGPTTNLAPGHRLAAWRTDRHRGGGTLFDKGVHHYDLWRFLAGSEVEEVSATTRAEGDDDRASVVTARLEGGVIASSVLAASEVASNQIVVLGSTGRLDVDLYRFDGLRLQPAGVDPASPRARLGHARRALAELPHGVRSLRAGGDYALAYAGEWRHLLDGIAAGADAESTFEDGREATRVAVAAIKSAQRGASVIVARGAAAVASP